MNKLPRFRFLFGIGTLFLMLSLLSACAEKLTEKRAAELVRLNYRQQSTQEGAGNWLVDTVQIESIVRIKPDSLEVYRVIAIANGLYQFPLAEGSPSKYTETFLDTLQFIARKKGKLWSADDWTVTGASNE
jgi:hypothetical protein